MDFFPVVNATLSSLHIAAFVKDAYKLGKSVTACILKAGISHTYLITDDSRKYIFRVYTLNWRTEIEISEEIRLLNLLKENNIPVSFAIADAQSVYIQQLRAPEGLRFGVLFTFAEGEKMLNLPATLHYRLGVIMANMHRVTHNLHLERVQYNSKLLLEDSFEQLGQFLPAATDEMIFMKSLQNYLREDFGGQGTSTLRKGVVHLDIWFDNISIDDNAGITLYDFDFCGNGWLVLDIAYYILQLYSTEKDENEFNLKKQRFLEGYESVTAVSNEEKRMIPAAGAALYFFYLGVQCHRYDNWSNVFLNEIYLKRFINLLLKKWVNFNQLEIEPLTKR